MEGTVKWFNKDKGFGFIQGDDGTDYFVHHTSLAQGVFLRENDKVSFESVKTEKGNQAKDVVLVKKDSE
ncbi:MAG: cold shock domain-containing protein [Candidatus Diapherotrites archaeon]